MFSIHLCLELHKLLLVVSRWSDWVRPTPQTLTDSVPPKLQLPVPVYLPVKPSDPGATTERMQGDRKEPEDGPEDRVEGRRQENDESKTFDDMVPAHHKVARSLMGE